MDDEKRSLIWNTLKDPGDDFGWEQASGTSLKVMVKRKREKVPASLVFFRLSLGNCLNYVFNCDDLLYIYLQQRIQLQKDSSTFDKLNDIKNKKTARRAFAFK